MTRFGLVRAELRRDLARVVGLSVAVAFGVAATALVLALERDAERLLATWAPASDRSLTVEPARLLLGSLSARLDDAVVTRLSLLPEVDRAVPRMLLRVPALSDYRGAFFGQNLDLTVEVAAEGVAEGAMTSSLFAGESFEWRRGQPLPICISEGLVAIYNSTFAPARGLPQLDARLLQGFEFPLTIGASMVGAGQGIRSANKETILARLVCVSPDAMLAGVTIPLAAARELNHAHGADSEAYSSVTLIAHDPSRLPQVEKAVVDAGFRVGEGQATARRLGRAVRLCALGLLGMAGLSLSFAAALVAMGFYGALTARAGELRLLSALGASRGFLRLEAMTEAACVGLLGSLLGLFIAWPAGIALDSSVRAAGFALPFALGWPGVMPSLAAICAGLLAAVWGALVAIHRLRNQFG